ncbi:hypothetical protein KSS87_020264 [Heliosperma pusillum]|nr:hypothetical protein KSS87_020264 [Heliosperma pusillum]
MDPPTATLMNETTSYNLSEIWPVPLNGGGPFGPNSTRFTDSGLIREGSGNDAVYNGSVRKRREKIIEDAAMSDTDSKRIKSSGSGDENQTQKGDGEVNSGKGAEKTSKAPLDAQKDYIHVRARRGQATDSHSLAERARREKISERMRILQDLVPGCNKVIGKALVLDEIINYIQSLQRQVEFLSMKLEAVNTRVSPGIEGFPSKDFGQQSFDTSGVGYCSQPAREYGHDPSPDWLHMHIGGGGFERQT